MARLTEAAIAAVIANGPKPPGNTKAEEWVALAMRESSGRTDVWSPSRRHRGLWQIGIFHNVLVKPEFSQTQFADWLTQPDNNWQAAVIVYNSQGWGAWAASHSPTAASRAAVQNPDVAAATRGGAVDPGLELPDIPIVSDVAEGIGSVASTLATVGGVIVDTAKWFGDPGNWLRILYVTGGLALGTLAAYSAFSDTKAGKQVISAGKAAATKGAMS